MIELRSATAAPSEIELEPRRLLPPRAREPERRDPRRGRAAARPRRRGRPGARDRGALPGGCGRRARRYSLMEWGGRVVPTAARPSVRARVRASRGFRRIRTDDRPFRKRCKTARFGSPSETGPAGSASGARKSIMMGTERMESPHDRRERPVTLGGGAPLLPRGTELAAREELARSRESARARYSIVAATARPS